MDTPFVGLTATDGQPVIVVIEHVTHLTVDTPQSTMINFVSGQGHRVKGTITDIAHRLWPPD